ncbi:type IV secretion system protein [Massilia scottii]|uniref:type IV secretion system protein n=1 Tax=Massilia scottii TaxID=3057166 RepID=UPI0027966001|nr:type IV secretion system protein [Massilia sp. CCM 9029]MDQ1835186.1 type IV secretion system protein [Massilia sp. CCM 9029]
MRKILFYTFFYLVLVFASPFALADVAPISTIESSSSMDTISSAITTLVTNTVGKIQGVAILWLSSLMLAQFLITNLGLLKSGADIEAVFGKLIGTLMWFGFCFYVVANGAGFISSVGNGFFDTASQLVGAGSYDAGTMMNKGVGIAANIIITVQTVAGITDFGSVMISGICGILVLLTIALIAFKIFIMKIELALVIMMSPLSFAFLGLNALKDQGIAPFKALISLMYRIMILGVIIVAMDDITLTTSKSLTSIYSQANFFTKVTGIGNGLWPAMLGITVSYLILGYLAFKSDSIASSLANGSTGIGTGDVASAIAMGAAAGAAVATAGASAAAAGSQVSQGMGDFMKSLMGGGGGSISNASGRGVGETGASGPSRAPSMSVGPSNSLNTPPQRPQDAAGRSDTASSSSNQHTASGSAGRGNEGSEPARPVSGGLGQTSMSTSDHQAIQSAPIDSSTSNPVHDLGQTAPLADSSPTNTPISSLTPSRSDSHTGIPSNGSGLPADVGQHTSPTGSSTSGLLYPPGRSGNPNTTAYSVPPSRNSGVEDNARSDGESVKGGSGATAGISGAQLDGADKAEPSSDAQNNSRQPRLLDRMKELNKHFQDEKASTHTSINLHGSD